jgi:hypothetical protein
MRAVDYLGLMGNTLQGVSSTQAPMQMLCRTTDGIFPVLRQNSPFLLTVLCSVASGLPLKARNISD